jgi:UDP-N-acetylmuramoyl-L-alanyl-D-glutamate--2,6-diaminopimelate ligase
MLRAIKALIGQRNPVRLAYHAFRALVAAAWYGFPARKLTVIGVTGTDGKTTTVGIIAHVLHEQRIPVGALSTAFFRIREDIQWNETRLTSPSPFVVQKFLRTLVQQHCTHAVVEYSSHGLVQHRLDWTFPKVAAITNLSEEHLDYHGSMEQYAKDKSLLFSMLKGKGVKVLNRDDRTYVLYRAITSEKTYTYGTQSPVDARQGEYACWLSGSTVTNHSSEAVLQWNTSEPPHSLALSMPGIFNLLNAQCAVACLHSIGVPVTDGLRALRTYKAPPGRMERIDEGQPFSVYVDFTVSPNAFVQTLDALRATLKDGARLLVLTGSCGNRMREKRPVIGRICSERADIVVITDDETYTEPTEQIMAEIWKGIDQSATQAHQIADRREAIAFILAQAKPGDSVLLCGMGSYPVRQTLHGLVPWNEQEIVRGMLRTVPTK